MSWTVGLALAKVGAAVIRSISRNWRCVALTKRSRADKTLILHVMRHMLHPFFEVGLASSTSPIEVWVEFNEALASLMSLNTGRMNFSRISCLGCKFFHLCVVTWWPELTEMNPPAFK